MDRHISQFRRPRSLLAVITAAVCAVLIPAGAYAAYAATSATASAGTGTGSTVSHMSPPVLLTTAQSDALKAAVRANPKLTTAEAEAVLGRSQARSVTPYARGTASGVCGKASLIGYPSGNYGYALFFDTATVGNPWFGDITISTNGIDASTDSYGIPPTSGSGIIDDVGVEPTGTTASGWAVTSGGWYCDIEVFAEW